jgi:hypothetical protein
MNIGIILFMLVAGLGNDEYITREKCHISLVKLNQQYDLREYLNTAGKNTTNPEIFARCKNINEAYYGNLPLQEKGPPELTAYNGIGDDSWEFIFNKYHWTEQINAGWNMLGVWEGQYVWRYQDEESIRKAGWEWLVYKMEEKINRQDLIEMIELMYANEKKGACFQPTVPEYLKHNHP